MNRPYRRLKQLYLATLVAAAIARANDATGPAQSAAVTNDEIAALLAAQPKWTGSATLHAGVGYRDNLLLSSTNPEKSGFVRAGLESLLWHVPQERIDYFGFINAERTQYFSGESVNHEAQAFVGAEWRYRAGDVFSATIDGQGYYLDQIFDTSDTSTTRVVTELQVTGGKLAPTLHWAFLPTLWLEGRFAGTRETYRDGLNNARLTEPRLQLGWAPNDRFELTATASEQHRHFDQRPRYTVSGKVDEGILVVHERELEAQAKVVVGASRHWTSRTRGGGFTYKDNGSGYLNYGEHHVAQEFEWEAGDWLVHCEGEARRKDYDIQIENHPGRLPGKDVHREIKDEYAAELRIERKLSSHWTLYAEMTWERCRSNDEFASYQVKEGLLGARWSWER